MICIGVTFFEDNISFHPMPLLRKALFFLILFTSLCESSTISDNEIAQGRMIRKLVGIPQNDVQCLHKDSRGFIWIGTLDGLHRYDGYDYRSYRVKPEGNCINSNLIMTVTEDRLGNIWIATYGKGLCKLDPRTELFRNYSDPDNPLLSSIPKDILCMMVDNNDVMWIGHYDGLVRVKLDGALDEPVEVVDVLDRQVEVKSIVQDKYGQIWFGGNGFLSKINYSSGAKNDIDIEEYPYSSAALTTFYDGVFSGGTIITAACKDHKSEKLKYDYYVIHQMQDDLGQHVNDLHYGSNTLWVGSRSGLKCLKRLEDGRWITTERFYTGDQYHSLDSNVVSSVISDDFGQVWVGTRGGGVTTIRETPQSFATYRQNDDEPESLSDSLTRCIFVDHRDNVWIGTENGGVNVVRSGSETSYKNGFQKLQINKIESENRVYSIAEVMTPQSSKHKSLLYMGTSYPTNLVAVDPDTLEILANPLGDNVVGFVFAIEVSSDGTIWVGTYASGLWRFETDNDGLIINSTQFSHDENNPYSLVSSIIRDLHLDSHGDLWISTDKGICVVEKQQQKQESPVFNRYVADGKSGSLTHDYILQVFEASDGQMWFGSMGGGLIKGVKNLESRELQFESITTANGLLNDSVKSIQEDEFGHLWLATNKGLTRFDPPSNRMIHFDSRDGLQDDEFSEICSARRADGQLIFGGRRGFNAFYPNQVMMDDVPPKVYINQLMVSNEEIEVGEEINGRVLLKKSIEFSEAIRLRYFENDISIGFVGLQYHSPMENKYRYMLDGYDSDWVYPDVGERIAKYTNLDAGEYVFKVMASNSEGVWVKEPSTLKIFITPPLWEMLWFRIGVVLGVLASFVAFYRARLSMLKKQKAILEAQVEERTHQLLELNEKLEASNAMKDKFFGILAHDLRSPFGSFMGLTDIMLQDVKSMSIDEVKDIAKMLNHSSKELFSLLENLLNWARVQQGVIAFEYSHLNFKSVLLEVFEQYHDTAEKKHITLVEDVPECLEVWADVNVLMTILRNLISNAIKFTHAGGTVRVFLHSKDDQFAQFGVKDSGIGMTEAMRKDLFRIDKKSNRVGTEGEPSSGLGLILCQEFIEQIGGEIKVQSEENVGTTFFITIPILETK